MRYKILIFLLSVVPLSGMNAQSTIDTILSSVSQKNKTLIANRQYSEAEKLQFRTGITPSDPFVEYDYLFGSPENAGNQTEFSVVQSLDFPTTYIKRSKLATEQQKQSDIKLSGIRQDVLLEAQKICIELIYRNRLDRQLDTRMRNAEKIEKNFKTMLEKGEGNILDVNKATLQLIEIKKQYLDNISTIGILKGQLAALNGGETIAFTDTIYPAYEVLSSFESHEAAFEAADPMRKSLEQETLIGQKRIELSRSLWLPKVEAGYHYQGILGQTYNGIHTGISIPLWQNRKTVSLAKTQMLFAEAELENHRNEHYFEIKQYYEKYLNLNATLKEYQSVLMGSNNAALLDKALSSGHISTIEYFMETNLFFTAYNNYLDLERDYYLIICELNKYKL